MKKAIPILYSNYGRYIDEFRVIPSMDDCLKCVERRCLYTLHEVAKKLTKSAKVVGDVIGKYHPHGDACLRYNTQIYDIQENKIYTIEEVTKLNKEPTVLIYDEVNNRIMVSKATNFRVGKRTNIMYKITLRFGNDQIAVLEVTDNHPIQLHNHKFIRADEIKMGDRLSSAILVDSEFLIDHSNIVYRLRNLPDVGYGFQKLPDALFKNKESENIIEVEDVKVIDLDHQEDFYDFTVKGFENMLIPKKLDDNRMIFICVHNSAYDTVVNLVHRGFAEGQGNFGHSALKPVSAAAYRYTEVKINPSLDDIAFSLIKFVPYSDPELMDELQPDYIPSPIPVGLIGDGIISGISFNTTKIPRYTVSDLFNRLINIFQRQVDPTIPPYTIIPNIPNFDIYEDQPGEYERILTTGEGKIKLFPHYKMDKDGIHVYGRPPLGCAGWLKEDADDKKIKYACDDLSGKAGFEALFTPKNGARLNQDFFNMIYFNVVSSTVSFLCNVWDGQNVVLKSIDELLLHGYNKWTEALKAKLQNDANVIRTRIREMFVIEIIKYLLTTSNNKITTIDDLCNYYIQQKNNLPKTFAQDVTVDEIKQTANKHTISKLFSYHINKQEGEKELLQINNILTNTFPTYAFETAKAFLGV